MPRQARIDIPGVIYHVISRGIERRKIFRDKSDRLDFLRRLEEGLSQTNTQCYAWVLMDNHFHLLLRPLRDPLSFLMKKMLTGYVGHFNAKYRRAGHLFQNRYKSIICQENVYFLELVRYIHLNPVRKRIVQTPDQLAKFPWTGHSTLVGNQDYPWQERGQVLSCFARRSKEAIINYTGFIKEGWNMGARKDLIGGGLKRSTAQVGGVDKMRKTNQRWQSDSQILGDGDFVAEILGETRANLDQEFILKRKYDLDSLGRIICQQMEITEEDLYSGRRLRRLSSAKGVYVYMAQTYLKETLVNIGQKLGICSSGALYEAKEKGRKYVAEHGNPLTE